MSDEVSDIRKDREELDKKFDEGLPSYLVDYFDEKEIQSLNKEYYRERAARKREYTPEERHEFGKKIEEDFWKINKTEIVKRKNPIRKDYTPSYEEPKRNKEIIEKEVELSPEEIKVLVSLCENDIYLFAIRYFSHYLKKPSSELHRFLYNTLEREIDKPKKLRDKGFKWAIAAPRGSAKSTLLSVILPLWCICYNKKKFIIIISNTASLSEDFLTDIKAELESNLALLRDFPEVCGKGPRWRSNEIITNNNIKVLTLGTQSQVRGRRFGTYRPDLILGDDLEDKDMIRSPTTMDFVRYTWFNKDVMFAGGEEDSPTDFLVLGTILGKDSLLNALLDPKEYPEWKSRRFKAVKRFSISPLWDEWASIYNNVFDVDRVDTAKEFFLDHKEEMLEGTEVLWPEGASYYSLMVEYLKDKSAFSSERQNNPVDITKILVTKEELHFDDFRKEEIRKILKRCHYFGALDPSLGRKKITGDYSCIVTLARDIKTGLLFVVDINIKRRSVDDQIDAILKQYINYKYTKFGVETNAFQLVVADNLRKKSRKLGYYIPIIELNNYTDKKMRVEGIIPLLKDKTIVFDRIKYENNQQYRLGLDQLLTFTGDGDLHDDFPDALEMVVRVAKANRFRRITKSTR